MDHKKSPKGRKRQAKQEDKRHTEKNFREPTEDHFWDCSVCTYKNNPEAFKCLMCDVRKGTSTRKPRLNPDLVAVQVQQALTPPPPSFKGFKDDFARAGSSSHTNGHQEPSTSSAAFSPSNEDREEAGPSSSSTASRGAGSTGGKKLKGSGRGRGSGAGGSGSRTPITNGAGASGAAGGSSTTGGGTSRGKLRNVDRKNAVTHSITVDNVTMPITEYRLKPRKERKSTAASAASERQSANGDAGKYGTSTGGRGGAGSDNDSDSVLDHEDSRDMGRVS